MYVTDDMIAAMKREYGTPELRQYHIETTDREVRRIRSSQHDGRNHDVTVYVEIWPDKLDQRVPLPAGHTTPSARQDPPEHSSDTQDSKLLVIAKHIYPPGLFRAPSGGLKPGEDFHDGVRREMTEELGCEVALDRFVLQTTVDFVHGSDTVSWRSFVFLGHYVSGDFRFTDHHEIREIAVVDWTDFARFGSVMRQTEIGGLHYRAALHKDVAELLGKPLR